MNILRKELEALMQREYPNGPVLGVGGVVFNNDHVLLVRRGKEPGYGKWSIPGGAIELGETLKEGLLREIMEETGLQVEVGGMVEVVEWVNRDENHRIKYHYVLIDFWCRCLSVEINPSSDALDARWVLFSEISNYDLPLVTLEVINKAFRSYRTALLK
jgi:ADP-ribose pyrophosphatase YjhB (NUDIX family)